MHFPFRIVRKKIKGNIYLQFLLMCVNDENPELPLLLVLVQASYRIKLFWIFYKALLILGKLDFTPGQVLWLLGSFLEGTVFPVFWKIEWISFRNWSYSGFSGLALGIWFLFSAPFCSYPVTCFVLTKARAT